MDSELVVISQLFPQAPYLEDFPRLAVSKPSERLCWLAYQWLDLRFALFLLTIMKESLQQSANTLVYKDKVKLWTYKEIQFNQTIFNDSPRC